MFYFVCASKTYADASTIAQSLPHLLICLLKPYTIVRDQLEKYRKIVARYLPTRILSNIIPFRDTNALVNYMINIAPYTCVDAFIQASTLHTGASDI